MRLNKTSFALLASILLASAISAQQVQKKAILPEVASASATKLNREINWHDSLESAAKQANKEGKLIFYMHMLGKIDGGT
jgi:hypothetical protein